MKKHGALGVLVSVAVCMATTWRASGESAVRLGARFYLGIEGSNQMGLSHRFGEYPLDIGNTWTYRNTYKSNIGTSTEIVVVTWTSEILVTNHVEIPEGVMVLRECTVRDIEYSYPEGTPGDDLTWIKKNIPPAECNHYLVFDSGYVEEIPARGWDASTETSG